jgi:hypothetical protein
MVWKDLCAFGAFNALYATYLELNPKIGGVIIRPDGSGNKKINLKSYWNFIKTPFNHNNPVQKELWKPKNWDINYAVCAASFMAGFKALSFMIEKVNCEEDDREEF